MGFLEMIFPKRADIARAKEFFQFLNGYTPVFTSSAGSVYESELIRSALDAHGRYNAKLRPVITGTTNETLNKRLMIRPNRWMTWPKFNYWVTQILYAKNTAFIVPVFNDYGTISGLTPINPKRWEVLDVAGEPWVRFYFENGQKAALELKHIGILTRFQFNNELFGEDNEALRSTLDLIELQKQGIQHGIRNSASYRFMAVAGNFAKAADLAQERKRFDENNFSKDSGGGGILLFPSTYKDVKQVDAKPYTVDADQMRLINESVMNYYSCNLDVIQNKAIGDSWLAYYEGAVEWYAVNISDVISFILYSEIELIHGNYFFMSSNRLQYMSTKDKLSAISTFADRGLMTRNELRDILNLPALPEPFGSQIPARGEYYSVNDEADQEDDDEGKGP